MILTSNILTCAKELSLTPALRDQILRQTKWDLPIYNLVDWDSHGKAFQTLRWVHRISTCKLIHGLHQTQSRDAKFYGSPPTCPLCHIAEETLNHVFSCSSPSATECWQAAYSHLRTCLIQGNTPRPILEAILHGITTNCQHASPTELSTHLTPSIKPSAIHLQAAFDEQTKHIGWDQFLRGRNSLRWGSAFRSSWGPTLHSEIDHTPWCKLLILSLWEYSTTLWKHRNAVVHGRDKEKAAALTLASIKTKVALAYADFEADPYIVSAPFNSLFLKYSLKDRLKMSQDTLLSWLRSVEEVKAHQAIFRDSVTRNGQRFLQSFAQSKSLVTSKAHSPAQPHSSRAELDPGWNTCCCLH